MLLQNLTLENFRGVRHFSLDLPAEGAAVHGANGTGKSSLMDAFLWLLTGKDSAGRADFRIKPQDAAGRTTPDIETTVSATLLIDDEPVTLTRTLRERWQKKRGTTEAAYTGDETKFTYNGVPLTARDYAAKIDALCPAAYLPLLANVNYFSEQTKDYKARRELLFAVFGTVTQADVIASNPELAPLAARLDRHTPDELRAILAAERRPLNEQLAALPVRIDEAAKSLPAPIDRESVTQERGTVLVKLATLQYDLKNGNDPAGRRALENACAEASAAFANAQARLSDQRRLLTEAARKKQDDLRKDAYDAYSAARMALADCDEKVQEYGSQVERYANRRAACLNRWHELNECTFDETALTCPTCGQLFPTERRDELIENFNTQKSKELSDCLLFGKESAKKRDAAQKELEKYQTEYAQLQEQVATKRADYDALCNAPPAAHDEALLTDLQADVEKKWAAAEAAAKALNDLNTAPGPNNDRLRGEIEQFQSKADALTAQLAAAEAAAETQTRIDDYRAKLDAVRKNLDENEQFTHQLDLYTRAMVGLVTKNINAHFKTVRWKLFEEQKNGGLRDICEATVGGVSYATLNTAAKINAGLDIITAFSAALGVTVPVFLDNRESVTEILPTPGTQIISLVVDPTAAELTTKK